MNNRIKVTMALSGIVVVIILAILIIAYFQNTSQLILHNSYPDSFPTLAMNTYTNKNLPGLELKYPYDWQIFVKEFGDKNSSGFKGTYFPECTENCMGLKFVKEKVSLNIIFDLVYDDSGKSCSKSVNYTIINENWARLHDSKGYRYVSNYTLNVKTTDNEYYTFGNAEDEWSFLNNQSYKICVNGSGYFREIKGVVNNVPGYPATLIESPVITGNPTAVDLNEIDNIVKTLN